MMLAREVMKIPVEERSIDRTELYVCDEAFLCGSAMELTPIYSVDRHVIGEEAGPITAQLRKLYLDCVSGDLPEYRNWLTPIYD